VTTDRPETPQGRHVRQLRDFLDLSQAKFGVLLELHQPDISQWEHPDRWHVALPSRLAKRFLEIWDCFPTPPEGGFDEILVRLAEYRRGKAVAGRSLIRLVPEKKVLHGKPPVIFWAPGEDGSSSGDDAPEPASEAPPPPSERDTRSKGRWQSRAWRWAAATSLVALLLPMGCFQAHEDARRQVTENSTPFLRAFRSETPDMGEKPPAERYIPKEPLPGQKLAPCDPEAGQEAFSGACWGRMDVKPPCGRKLYRGGNSCYLPIAADPLVPVGEPTQPSRMRAPRMRR
jgi:hypothetical protein